MDDNSLVYSHEVAFPFEQWTNWAQCKVYFLDAPPLDAEDDYGDESAEGLFPYEKDDRIRTHDLQNADYNSLCGKVVHHADNDGRYMVELDLHEDAHADGTAKKVRFKPENMILQSHQGGGSVRTQPMLL